MQMPPERTSVCINSIICSQIYYFSKDVAHEVRDDIFSKERSRRGAYNNNILKKWCSIELDLVVVRVLYY